MQAFLGLGHPQIRETRLLMATLEDMKSVASSSNRGIADYLQAAGIALNSKAADVREHLDRVQVFALGLAAMGAADKAQNGHIANATRSAHGRNLTVYLRRNNPGVIAALADIDTSVADAAAKISTYSGTPAAAAPIAPTNAWHNSSRPAPVLAEHSSDIRGCQAKPKPPTHFKKVAEALGKKQSEARVKNEPGPSSSKAEQKKEEAQDPLKLLLRTSCR